MSQNSPADRNRRVFFRLPIHLPVSFRLTGEVPGPWLRGRTVNLSAGGLLLQGPMLKDGDQDALLMGYQGLDIELQLPSGRSLELRGAAVWMEDVEASSDLLNLGVEFQEMSQAALDELQSFVQGCCEAARSTGT